MAGVPHIMHSQFILDTNQLGGDQSPIDESKLNNSVRVTKGRVKESSGRMQENPFAGDESVKSEASSRFKGSPKK